MGYLITQILVFLLLAALLGFIIGWLWRGARFDSELKDLDARWRAKLTDVEGERDRFAGEVTQANEARATSEAAEAEARRLVETHEGSLDQLRREHQTKLSALADVEKRVGGLEGDLAARTKELAEAKASSAGNQAGGGDLAAATARTETLERELRQAKEANGACKREVERLEARVAELQRGAGAGGTSGGGALGLMGSTGAAVDDEPSGSTGGSGSGSAAGAGGGGAPGSAGAGGSGSTGGAAGSGTSTSTSGGGSGSTGGGALGLVGGTDSIAGGGTGGGAGGSAGSGSSGGSSGAGGSAGQNPPGYSQRAAAPSQLAEGGGQSFVGALGSTSTSGDEDAEGVRPEALSGARGGVADDLKKISGVGPKLEKTLNGLGIYHFSQIAAFTPDNVAWVDRHLRFKGRIEREKWIEQAKVLASGGETEFSRRN